jgi:hypothetical protein
VLDRIAAAPKPVDLINAGGEAAVLLLLATGSRLSDILHLRARYEKTDFGVRQFLFAPRKTDLRKEFIVYLKVGFFPENRRICPARALLRYLRLAFPLRCSTVDRIFISSTGYPASRRTVKHWIEDQLNRSGVVTSAGSLCSASTSAAFLSGVDVDAILKSVGWKPEETWRRHYLRPIFEPNLLFRAYAPQT